jgi:hypothetical protein
MSLRRAASLCLVPLLLVGCPADSGEGKTGATADSGLEGGATPQEVVDIYNRSYKERDWGTWLGCVRSSDREQWVAGEISQASSAARQSDQPEQAQQELRAILDKHGVKHMSSFEVVADDLVALLADIEAFRERAGGLPERKIEGTLHVEGERARMERTAGGSTNLAQLEGRWYLSFR